jgi:hypothetical protein
MATQQKPKREYSVSKKVTSFLIVPMPKTAKDVLRKLADSENRTKVNQLSIIAGQAPENLYDYYKSEQSKSLRKLNYLLMRDIKKYIVLNKEHKKLYSIVKNWKV